MRPKSGRLASIPTLILPLWMALAPASAWSAARLSGPSSAPASVAATATGGGTAVAVSASPASSPSAGGGATDPLASAVASYGELLTRYVQPGGVRYSVWRAADADVRKLSEAVARFSSADPSKFEPQDRYALYINLYNAKILETVLKGNPKSSIKEITPGITGFGVFRKEALEFDGKKISLTDLETRLRDESKDPRVHFAVNCASRSCPPIAAEPYRGGTLGAQLDKSARSFLASPGALIVKKDTRPDSPAVTIECSKIFDWYGKDFDAAGGVVAFMEKLGPADVASALKAAGKAVKLDYQEYDWSLNTAP